jgi:Cu/Ag efflux pump CusA
MFGWATRFGTQFRILVLAHAWGLFTFSVVNVPHFWLPLTAFAAVPAIASRNAALLSARVDEPWRESQQMSCAKAVMTADRDRMSPLLKSALITLHVLVPPAVLGGTVGQALMAPKLLIIARNLLTMPEKVEV